MSAGDNGFVTTSHKSVANLDLRATVWSFQCQVAPPVGLIRE
jgi:hypothetical protein